MRRALLLPIAALLLCALGAGCATVAKDLDTARTTKKAKEKDANAEDRADAIAHLDQRVQEGDGDYVARKAEVVSLMRLLLEDPSALVRHAAIDCLADLDGKSAGPLLADRLRDKDPWVRFAAARRLADAGGPEQIEPLIAALRSDTSVDVRWAAAASLGHLRASEALYDLYLALGDQPTVRYRAYIALKEITGKDAGLDAAAWRELIPKSAPAGGH